MSDSIHVIVSKYMRPDDPPVLIVSPKYFAELNEAHPELVAETFEKLLGQAAGVAPGYDKDPLDP